MLSQIEDYLTDPDFWYIDYEKVTESTQFLCKMIDIAEKCGVLTTKMPEGSFAQYFNEKRKIGSFFDHI